MKSALILTFTIGLLVVASMGTYAYQQGAINEQIGTFHDNIMNIMENGNYEDLVDLREETGRNMVNKVQSQEDFNEWKDNGCQGGQNHKGRDGGCNGGCQGGCGNTNCPYQ